MLMSRSTMPQTRNPLLLLPAALKFAALPAEISALLREMLQQLGREANEKAQKSWRTHKAPMAVYWKMVAVYSRHLARLLSPKTKHPSDIKEEANGFGDTQIYPFTGEDDPHGLTIIHVTVTPQGIVLFDGGKRWTQHEADRLQVAFTRAFQIANERAAALGNELR